MVFGESWGNHAARFNQLILMENVRNAHLITHTKGFKKNLYTGNNPPNLVFVYYGPTNFLSIQRLTRVYFKYTVRKSELEYLNFYLTIFPCTECLQNLHTIQLARENLKFVKFLRHRFAVNATLGSQYTTDKAQTKYKS